MDRVIRICAQTWLSVGVRALGSEEGGLAAERAAAQLAAHERVREAARTKGRVGIQPVLPVDILGAYVLIPAPSHSAA